MSTIAWKCEPYDASKDGLAATPSQPIATGLKNLVEFPMAKQKEIATAKTVQNMMTVEEATAKAVHTSRRVTLCEGPGNQIHIFNGGFS